MHILRCVGAVDANGDDWRLSKDCSQGRFAIWTSKYQNIFLYIALGRYFADPITVYKPKIAILITLYGLRVQIKLQPRSEN